MKIGFIGLGKLGLPCAEVFSKYFNVIGYDILPVKTDNVTIVNSLKEVVELCKFIFIAIQTPHNKEYGGEMPTSHLPAKDFDYTNLRNVISEINRYAENGHTVIIISTVLPGTIRSQIKPLLHRGKLIYNPYLIAMGTVKEDMVNPEMIILGSENGNISSDFRELISIYESIISRPVRYEMGSWEEAESIKIFYNTFISAKIAIVNMIQDVAEHIGNMNVDIVTNALAKSDKRIISKAYMKAGMGDGGPCHPRDNIALSWLAQHLGLNYNLFDSINISREKQAMNLAEKLMSFNKPVVILGTNYKPNVTLKDGSYSLLVAHYIKAANHLVYLDNHEDTIISYTYLIAHEHIYNDFPFTENSIVLDVWRSFKTSREDLEVVLYGDTRIPLKH